jgi:hypothetical protein
MSERNSPRAAIVKWLVGGGAAEITGANNGENYSTVGLSRQGLKPRFFRASTYGLKPVPFNDSKAIAL